MSTDSKDDRGPSLEQADTKTTPAFPTETPLSPPISVPPEVAAAAEELKTKGNACFREGDYAGAVKLYQQAIEKNPSLIPAYTNLAFCHIKLEEFGAVVDVCTRALIHDPSCVKALYRRAVGYRMLNKLSEAISDLRAAHRLKPEDGDIVAKLNDALRERKRQQIISAIRIDDPVPLYQKLAAKIPSWTPADKYDGPTFDREVGPTTDFCEGMLTHFFNEKALDKVFVYSLLLRVRDQLAALPNIVPVTVPDDAHIHVCGDTHGQFYDVHHIFATKGMPSETNRFLFNGDFVDRGSFSVEVALTMLAWKCALPNHFFISRGNHEARDQNKIFGFEGEVKAKYNDEVFELFMEVFQAMPLGHVINNHTFVVHGGLCSSDGVTIADLNGVNRFVDNIQPGLMADLLWSDPADNPLQVGRVSSKRGIGIEFGSDVTRDFLNTNSLSMVVRSHQVRDAGYTVEHDGKLVTVFSAPNYCDTLGNAAAVMTFQGKDMSYEFWTFKSQPHPDVRPMQYSRLPMWMNS